MGIQVFSGKQRPLLEPGVGVLDLEKIHRYHSAMVRHLSSCWCVVAWAEKMLLICWKCETRLLYFLLLLPSNSRSCSWTWISQTPVGPLPPPVSEKNCGDNWNGTNILPSTQPSVSKETESTDPDQWPDVIYHQASDSGCSTILFLS